jgi:hypothetical protein
MQSLAQKKARENFKKAIEYRKKTGCSLKEAFAHVSGKKTVVKKKATLKKKTVKKVAKKKVGVIKKKAAKKKAIKKPSEQSILNKIHKVKHDVERLDESQHKHMMSGIEDKMFKDLYDTRERIANTKKAILKLQTFSKVSPTQKHIFQNKAKQYKKYLIELNTHYRELKKHI